MNFMFLPLALFSFLYLAPPQDREAEMNASLAWQPQSAFYDRVHFPDGTEGNLVLLMLEKKMSCSEFIDKVHLGERWTTKAVDALGARLSLTFLNIYPDIQPLGKSLDISIGGLHGMNARLEDKGTPLVTLDFSLPSDSRLHWGLWGELTIHRTQEGLEGKLTSVMNAGALQGAFKASPCPFFPSAP